LQNQHTQHGSTAHCTAIVTPETVYTAYSLRNKHGHSVQDIIGTN